MLVEWIYLLSCPPNLCISRSSFSFAVQSLQPGSTLEGFTPSPLECIAAVGIRLRTRTSDTNLKSLSAVNFKRVRLDASLPGFNGGCLETKLSLRQLTTSRDLQNAALSSGLAEITHSMASARTPVLVVFAAVDPASTGPPLQRLSIQSAGPVPPKAV
jgi:hypothetical protein